MTKTTITITEISTRLGVSKCSVYDMLNAGMIPAVRLPNAKCGKWIISRMAYERWEGTVGEKTGENPVDKTAAVLDNGSSAKVGHFQSHASVESAPQA